MIVFHVQGRKAVPVLRVPEAVQQSGPREEALPAHAPRTLVRPEPNPTPPAEKRVGDVVLPEVQLELGGGERRH